MFLDSQISLKRKDIDRFLTLFVNDTKDKISLIHEGKSSTIKKELMEEVYEIEDLLSQELAEKCSIKKMTNRDLIIFQFYLEQIELVGSDSLKKPTVN